MTAPCVTVLCRSSADTLVYHLLKTTYVDTWLCLNSTHRIVIHCWNKNKSFLVVRNYIYYVTVYDCPWEAEWPWFLPGCPGIGKGLGSGPLPQSICTRQPVLQVLNSLWVFLGACSRGNILGPCPRLLNQNLHFHQVLTFTLEHITFRMLSSLHALTLCGDTLSSGLQRPCSEQRHLLYLYPPFLLVLLLQVAVCQTLG